MVSRPKELLDIQEKFIGLYSRLLEFCLLEEFAEDLGHALEYFYNLDEKEEYVFKPDEEFLFLTWFLVDNKDDTGVSLLDIFIQRNLHTLDRQELEICEILSNTYLSLYKVVKVYKGNRLILHDLFLDEELDVYESAGSLDAEVGELLYSRVIKLYNYRFLVGAGVYLDSSLQDAIIRFVEKHYNAEINSDASISMKNYLKKHGEVINWWIQAFRKSREIHGPYLPI